MAKFKEKLYDILENDEIKSPAKYIFDMVLATIIIVSIIVIFLENEKGNLPKSLKFLDIGFTIFFIIEFLLRFYVASDFRKDYNNKGLKIALYNKAKWFSKPTTIIDFLAIIPSINYFRIFRTFRFIRLLRVFKVYRSVKIFKEADKIFTILKGMKEENRVFSVFLVITIFLVTLISFALYLSESDYNETEFKSFKDAIWYSFKIIGLGDDTPKTRPGKFFATLLLLTNMAIFGFFVSLILNKIQNIMTAITSGKIGQLKLENHIVICGYTKSSQNVIDDLLKDKNNYNNIILITEKEIVDDLQGVIYMSADYTEHKTLINANISKAKYAIVFAEMRPNDTIKDTDLRTVMTIFYIEKEAPHVHTIAEIFDETNAEIIKDKINGDEILFKEKIDSKIITSCVKHQHISNLFYDLFDNSQEKLRETDLKELGIKDNTSVKKIRDIFNQTNRTLIGLINSENQAILSPANEHLVKTNDRLIYLKNK